MVEVQPIRGGRVRQADILAAAEREFAVLGWSGARMERIARSARVNKQLLFHYFESKAGLYAAALASLLARYEPASDPASSLVDEVRRVIRAVETAARSVPGVVLQTANPSDSDDVPSAALQAVRAWRERQFARLAHAITEGQRRGHFRDDLDPHAAALVGLALALGSGALGTESDAATWMVDYCAWR